MSDSLRVPAGWALVPLGELGQWTGGGTPSKNDSSFWNGGLIPWVSPKDMKTPVIIDSLDHITQSAIESSAAKLIPADSVLFVTRSGILEHTFPVARTAVPVTVNQDIKALTPFHPLNPNYIASGTRAFASEILRCCSKDGTTVASVDTALLQNFALPVAPVSEQHRIVETIESYLTRLDDAKATLERVQRNLKRYRASVLKAAVEGRLVPTEAELARADGREYESASVLLERILVERRRRWEEAELAKMKAKGKVPKNDKWKARYVEPVGPDTSELPELPEGWCWSTIDQLSQLVRNGYTKKPSPQGGVRILRISAVREMNVDFDDCRWLPGGPEDYEADLVNEGDLLFTRYNGTSALVGVSGLVRAIGRPTVHPDKLIKVRPINLLLNLSYLELSVNTGISRRFVESRIRTTAGQAGVSGGDVKKIPIPLPPLAEQNRIIDEQECVLAFASSTSTALAASRARGMRLRQSILKWAFEGRLVDQDPTDEPAEVLLARIRAERAAQPVRARRRRA
ncbi:MAG: restriction endonuclease subunit S [Cyanobium sp.]